MKKVIFELYEYSELSEKAKAHAKTEYGSNYSYTEYEFASDAFTAECAQRLAEKGLPTKVLYSLGHCQGDGLSCSGEIDLKKLVESYPTETEKFLPLFGISELTMAANLKRGSSRYCYSRTSVLEMERTWDTGCENFQEGFTEDLWEAFKVWVYDKYLDVCRELEKRGYEVFDELYTDEYIEQYFENTNTFFFSNGRVVSDRLMEEAFEQEGAKQCQETTVSSKP